MQLKPIRQQVVVVMGASSGIGKETALRFARHGARVVVAARSEAGLNTVVEEIQNEGGKALAVPADTAEFEQVKRVADRAAAEFDSIDTWVQVAGVSLYARFEDTTPEEWRRVIDVNLNGPAYGAMAALPHLRRQGGALICVSSVEARRAFPFQAAYSASKHGVKAMCEALRQELEVEGTPVSVTEILPATINTPLFDNARTKLGVKPAGIPPVYPPESVAKLILYAAEHPVRELVVGGATRALIAGESLSPSLMDSLLGRIAYEKQKTTHPKTEEDRDNLFHPIDESQSIQGTFTHMERAGSLYSWASTHRWHVGALAMAALGTAAIIARGEEEREPRRRRVRSRVAARHRR